MSLRRLHVVGCPRSGTTLMMELLWLSYDLGGRCEHELSLFDEPMIPKDLYLTKKPSDTYRLEQLLRIDADLYVIAMQRDPRAVISSRHVRRPGEYYCDFARWQLHQDAIEALRGHPRFVAVKFETLLADPDLIQRTLETQLNCLSGKQGGTRRARFSEYPDGEHVTAAARQALNGVRPFDTSRLTSWHAHLPRVKQQLASFTAMQSYLERLKYCDDASWQEILSTVEALPPARSRAPHFFKRCETAMRYALKARRYRRIRLGGMGSE